MVKEVIRDTIGMYEPDNPTWQSLEHLFGTEGAKKGQEFIRTAKKEGAAFNWEITFRLAESDYTLAFSCIETGDGLIIIGTDTPDETEKFVNGLMKMNNEQVNKLRHFMKNTSAREFEDDWDMYNDLTSLNNELANTKRKLTKKSAELERINTLKDQMLGMAAHDLRNPLTVIQNFASFLMDDFDKDGADDDKYELAKEIKKSSEHMVRIVEDLLDISAIESGSVKLDKQNTDIKELISHAVSTNRPSAEKKNIELSVDLADAPCTKKVDPHKMQQVLNNLISNAIKYSNPGTTTTVGLVFDESDTGSSKKSTKIYVADQGQGIPEKDREKLFQPFATINVEATAGETSTGLGLAITKKIVQAHGGSIEVESEVDKGTTFFITLPE